MTVTRLIVRAQNAADAAARTHGDRARAVEEHAAVTSAVFEEARLAARSLQARGFPGIQVVAHWTKRGWLRAGHAVEMGGWMVYDLGDGGDGSPSTKIYLLSDGRIQIHGGTPIASADRLLTLGHAQRLLRALQRMSKPSI